MYLITLLKFYLFLETGRKKIFFKGKFQDAFFNKFINTFLFLETGRKKIFFKGKFQDVFFNNFINTFLLLETGRKKIFFKGKFKIIYLTKLLKYFIFLFCRRWVANGTDVLVVQPGYQIILIANRYQNLPNFINEVIPQPTL